MRLRRLLLLGASVLISSLFLASHPSTGQPMQKRVVRLAEIEIDPAHLEEYKAALKEEIEASIRVEPGVLTLYAVSVKDNPAQIRIFEVYANPAAYQSHLRTAHFQKYKTSTQTMVKSLRLIESDPILLGSKSVRE